jgi:hypothetical protein
VGVLAGGVRVDERSADVQVDGGVVVILEVPMVVVEAFVVDADFDPYAGVFGPYSFDVSDFAEMPLIGVFGIDRGEGG